MKQFKESKILVGESSSGSKKYISHFQFDSGKKGKYVYIQAGLHGPEIASVAVVYKLLEYLQTVEFTGVIDLIPIANPWGIDTKFEGKQCGYINHNSTLHSDWNSIFSDISEQILEKAKLNKASENDPELIKKQAIAIIKNEYAAKKKELTLKKEDILNYKLLQISLQADIVIDLHCAGDCVKHIYTFQHSLEHSKYFNLENIILLDFIHTQAFDESHIIFWNELFKKNYIKEIPVKAYTVEFFADAYSSESEVLEDTQKIINYLEFEDVLSSTKKQKIDPYNIFSASEEVQLTSPMGGIFHSAVQKGQFIKKAELLGYVLSPHKKTPIYSPVNGFIYKLPANYALETGENLISIFTTE